jgi:hypothetical protein
MKKDYPQLKYIRECRKDPVFVRHELDRQKVLRRKKKRSTLSTSPVKP